MKVMKFQATPYIHRAICECGEEMQCAGESNGEFRHNCPECRSYQFLSQEHPCTKFEQASPIGEEVK